MEVSMKGNGTKADSASLMEKVELDGRRELEKCRECGGKFLSFYPIEDCIDHAELEEID
jgi:hypothetical protein